MCVCRVYPGKCLCVCTSMPVYVFAVFVRTIGTRVHMCVCARWGDDAPQTALSSLLLFFVPFYLIDLPPLLVFS